MTDQRRHSFDPAPEVPLTSAGAKRRAQILDHLHAELDRRAARRRVRGTSGAVLAAGLVIAAAWAWMPANPGPQAPGPGPVARSDSANTAARPTPPLTAPAPSETRSYITIVEADPSIMQRFAIATIPGAIEVISDSTLQTELAAVGIDHGLVTINGRTLTALGVGETYMSQPR